MTRSVLLLSLAAALGLASAASAQPQQEQAPATVTVASESAGGKTAVTGDPNRRICKAVKITGTRLGKGKICRTAGEWAEQTAQTRQNLEKAQTQTGLKGN